MDSKNLYIDRPPPQNYYGGLYIYSHQDKTQPKINVGHIPLYNPRVKPTTTITKRVSIIPFLEKSYNIICLVGVGGVSLFFYHCGVIIWNLAFY